MRRLEFHPARHGFHFPNLFVNNVSPGITTYGLCGGMALAVARYWLARLPIPTHTTADFPDGSPAGVPPPGSPLHGYIYDCQLASYGPLNIVSAANWVVFPHVTWDDQFNWSVAEFTAARRLIDAGLPALLGLRQRKAGDAAGHQVLAYGYDEATWTLLVYEPNFPDQEITMRLDHGARRIVHSGEGSPEWSSYFVTGCPIEGPRPPYVDLGLQLGIHVQAASPSPVGARVSVDLCVRNFGFRDAHVKQLFVYVRGPRGENLDALLGGGDNDPRPIPPGGERRIQRVCASFGGVAGNYTIGASYLSDQDQWINLPAIAGGTRNEVRLAVVDAQRSPAAPWASLGGVLSSPLAAASNADGRLEVFGRGTDNRIWRLAQKDLARPHEFSGWELMPGDQTFNGAPAVVRNHFKKLEVFARGRDGAIWHRWQNDPNVGSAAQWSPWNSFGGVLTSDPTLAQNHDGRLEVFAVGSDGRVYHIYQRWFDAFGAPWSGWEALGSRRFAGRIAAERDGSGCLWAYARSRDDSTIWRCRQTSPSGPWSDWSPTHGNGDEPALGRNNDGRLEAFVRGLDGKIWHEWQGAPGADFSGWHLLRPDARRPVVLDAGAHPVVWNQADGALAVAAVEGDGEVDIIVRTNQDPWWTDFQLVGSEITSEVAAASGGGQTGLFALGRARDLRFVIRRP